MSTLTVNLVTINPSDPAQGPSHASYEVPLAEGCITIVSDGSRGYLALGTAGVHVWLHAILSMTIGPAVAA